jgi:choline monooxygenase
MLSTAQVHMGRRGARTSEEILADAQERLGRGRTPPADFYTSPELYALEREHIFGSIWQLVGATTQIPEAGNYLVTQTDEQREFVLFRDHDGTIRGFHNVCVHRGNRLVSESGRTGRTIQCGYHGWTYTLDGKLHAARGLENASDFNPADFGLMEVAVEVTDPFVWLNPSASPEPLASHLGSLPDRLAALGIDMPQIARDGHVEVVDSILECNWKMAVENSLECYHCSISHPGLGATFDLDRWHITTTDRCIIQGAGIRSADAPAGGRAAETRMGPIAMAAATGPGGIDEAVFHFVFPNNSVSLWPGPGNSFNCARWIPLGPDRTRWWSMRWWPEDGDPVALKEQWDFMLQVGWEDKDIVEGLQIGVASGAWRGGVFDLRDERSGEHGVHRFDSLVSDWLNGAADA